MDKQLENMLTKGKKEGALLELELDALLDKLNLPEEELLKIDQFLVDNDIELLNSADSHDWWQEEEQPEEDIIFAPPEELAKINTALLSAEKIRALSSQLSSKLNSLNLYLQDIAQIDVLAEEEENELFAKVAMGDKKAAKMLFHHSQNLIMTVTVDYMTSEVPFMELIQEANMGLYQALESYNPDFSFRAQGIWWVKHQLDKYLKDDDIIRIPANILEDIKKLQDKEAKLGEMELDELELAKELDWDLEYLQELKSIIRNPQILEDYFEAKEEEERFLAELDDEWAEENDDEMAYPLAQDWEEEFFSDDEEEIGEKTENKSDLLHNMQKRSQSRQNQPKHGYYHK